jgi:hypothetical protein
MTVFGLRLRCLIAGLLPAAAVLCVCCPPARAGSILWYNGNLDQRDAIVNQTGNVNGAYVGPDGLIYDNFIVPTGETFTITGVFSNDAIANSGPLATTAYWEIRSGVSAGDGGTLVASGDGTDVTTATGQDFNFGGLSIPVFTNEVNGLTVTVGAGTYWLAVAPDVGNQNSFIVTTSGSGAIGTPPGNDGNSFFSSTFFGDSFLPTTDPSIEGPGTWDYSMGIVGAATVPEPSSVIMGMIGVVVSAGCVCTRRRARS